MGINGIHTPVMSGEVIAYLKLKPNSVILDCTVGNGGHSEAILERIAPAGKVIGIDQDEEILERAKKRLSKYGSSFTPVYNNFRNLNSVLDKFKICEVDGVLFDLGVSSFQLDDFMRGFSIKADGPLDMRMDKNNTITAGDLVNKLSFDEIISILKTFGEERWAKRIALNILKERDKEVIKTTKQLAEIILRAVPYKGYQRIHPATRTFQALRIAVNQELSSLEEAVAKAVECVKPNGRICVISFHSLEDRIVKHLFRDFSNKGILNIITKKPIRPTNKESEINPRSRSAKLRAGERAV